MKHVCPLHKARKLDNWLRRLLHPPSMLYPYVRKGMMVLDFGCGPGMFSIALARRGCKVIAADLQQGMLDILAKKIKDEDITLVKVPNNSISVKEKVGFILAFFVVHEVPSQDKFFSEAYSILEEGGKMFVAEPKHRVSEEEFEESVNAAKKAGFGVLKIKKLFMGMAVVLEKD